MTSRKQIARVGRWVGMRAVAGLFCGLIFIAPAAGSTNSIAISINDRTAEVQGLLISQKVLMPMRALFTALGAGIEYDAKRHKVYARSQHHRIALTIGTHGSRLVHFRTYVPLRYLGEALGATVDYDATTRSVAIYSPRGSSTSALSEARFAVSRRYPAPGQRVAGAYAITATITSVNGPGPKRSHLHMFLDGVDVANAADFNGSNIAYRPQRELDYGRHDVRLEWVDNDGRGSSSEWWWFQAPATSSGYAGYAYTPYSTGINLGFRFYPTGPVTYFAGDLIRLILIAPAGGRAFVRLCGMPGVYYLNYNWAFNYYALSLPAPSGFYLPGCTATAFFNGRNGLRQVVPLRSRINVFTTTRRAISPPPLRPLATPAPQKTLTPMAVKRRIKPIPTVLRPPQR